MVMNLPLKQTPLLWESVLTSLTRKQLWLRYGQRFAPVIVDVILGKAWEQDAFHLQGRYWKGVKIVIPPKPPYSSPWDYHKRNKNNHIWARLATVLFVYSLRDHGPKLGFVANHALSVTTDHSKMRQGIVCWRSSPRTGPQEVGLRWLHTF